MFNILLFVISYISKIIYLIHNIYNYLQLINYLKIITITIEPFFMAFGRRLPCDMSLLRLQNKHVTKFGRVTNDYYDQDDMPSGLLSTSNL